MSVWEILFAVMITGIALSYGWGMRGTIIGGEKGALLPGALLGLCISVFAGNGILLPYLPFFTAVGALGMFYGGTEPYAQTMSHILSRDKKGSFYEGKAKKGAVGIFLKGGLWFGISAGLLALLPSAFAGEIGKWEFTALFLLIPVLSVIGTAVWNKPFDAKKEIYPKIYFSNGSREEWGGNVLIFLSLLLTAVIHKSLFVFGAGIIGFVSGGFGFLLGLLCYDYTVRKHNGRFLFGSLQEKGYINGWKIMEHFFGAFAGGGVMLYFCLNEKTLMNLAGQIEKASLIHRGDFFDTVTSILIPVLLVITALQYPTAKIYRKKHGREPDIHVFELLERPLFSAIPLIFVFWGGEKTAMSVAFMTLLYALCEKSAFEWFRDCKMKNIFSAVYIAVFICAGMLFYAAADTEKLYIPLLILYTFGYTATVWCYVLMPEKLAEKKRRGLSLPVFMKSDFNVYGHFILQCIVLTVVLTYKFTGGMA